MRWSERAIQVREQLSKRAILRFLVLFILATVLFFSTQNEYLEAIFGFAMIISGSIILLFIIILLIFTILDGIKHRKEKKKASKKSSAKKTSKKKSTAKKSTTKKKSTSKKKK